MYNGQGHLIKMATMAINSKSLLKIFFRHRRTMALKLGMKHQGMKFYKIYINHDPTYLTTRTTYVAHAFVWGKLSKCHLKGKLSGNGQLN